jgi:hypothetical protein
VAGQVVTVIAVYIWIKSTNRMKYSPIFTIILLSILTSCSKNDCNEKILFAKYLESDYECVNTKYSLVIDLQDSAKIIRSKEAYDAEVSGPCHPDIDFSKYDLVIGEQSSGNENDTIIYDYRLTCPNNELTLTVDIIQSVATRPDNVVYHAIIPKLGDEEIFHIIVNVK